MQGHDNNHQQQRRRRQRRLQEQQLPQPNLAITEITTTIIIKNNYKHKGAKQKRRVNKI